MTGKTPRYTNRSTP